MYKPCYLTIKQKQSLYIDRRNGYFVIFAFFNFAKFQPNLEQLEKTVEELKRKQQAAKSKAKGLVSDVDTPNSTSRQSRFCLIFFYISNYM